MVNFLGKTQSDDLVEFNFATDAVLEHNNPYSAIEFSAIFISFE